MSDDFKEEDIRPDDLNDLLDVYYEEDVTWLRSKAGDFKEVNCPACGSDRRAPLFTKDEFHYHTCANCATAYISPRPTVDLLQQFYAVSKVYSHFNEKIFPASEKVRREKIFKPRLNRLIELCQKYDKPNANMVEVGAGFGLFCEEATKSGFFKSITGIEPGGSLAETCRQRGLNIIEKVVEDVKPAELGPVDVICSFEVIEHLFSPKDFLQSFHHLLSDNGLIFLTCPSAAGFDLQMLGQHSGTYNFEHINYFTPKSLSLLMEECGFRVIDVSTPGKLDAELVRKGVLNGQINLSENRFLHNILISNWDRCGSSFQTFLAENLMSGHLQILAQKI